jgi:hypothetical protein
LRDGGGEGFLRGFFGEVEITDEFDERGDDAAPIAAVKFVYGLGNSGFHIFFGHCRIRCPSFDLPVKDDETAREDLL